MGLLQLMIVGLLLALNVAQSHQDEELIVTLKNGKIKGFKGATTKGRDMFIFRGIPYAKPPIGELRFQDPQPANNWTGILDGMQLPPLCTQYDIDVRMSTQEFVYDGQEDCLYLNVYTPKLNSRGELMPVMVFIHGGGFACGSSNEYEGHELLNEDVILVVMNYRLGVLGFLSTGDDVISGNFGLKDQTLALRWVHDNICHFGGDPSQVTIFGQSSGGASTHYQVLTPETKGLFTRAILHSGTAVCPWSHSDGHRDVALQIGALMGCFASADSGERKSKRLLQCLQQADPIELTKMIEKFVVHGWAPSVFNPRVDGKYIPDIPQILLRDSRHNMVDLMVGVTKDDGGFSTYDLYEFENQLRELEEDFDYIGPILLILNHEHSPEEKSRKAFQFYTGNTRSFATKAEEIKELYGDRMFALCHHDTALFHSKNVKKENKNVFLYEYSHRGQRSFGDIYTVDVGINWVNHWDEMLLLFPINSFGDITTRNQEDSQMRDTLVKLWTNFAKNGNPTPDDSMGYTWDPFTEKSQRHLVIKLNSEMRDDQRMKVREFWRSLGLKYDELLHGTRKNYSAKDEL